MQPLPSHVYEQDGKLYIDSMEGRHLVDYGYWRIIGVKGEAYGCAGAIFDATYEPVTHA